MSYSGLDEEITVFQYTFIDDPEGFRKPEEVLPLTSNSLASLDKVKAAFKKSGWEGDGEIGLTWIPACFFIAPPDIDPGQQFGTYIWHVKQHNNGVSFLGFYPDGLNFIAKNSLLAIQNEGLFDV